MILQKPLGSDWDESREIVETARKAGVRLAIHENFRWQSPMRKLKAVIDSGAIGKPTWARIAFRTGYDIYAVQPYLHQAKRYAILDVGIHVLDLARFFLGDVERVSCETQIRNPENVGEDTATIMMRHRSGAVSVVECSMESRIDPDPFPETLVTIEGERGSASDRSGTRRTRHIGRAEHRESDFRLAAAVLDLAALAYRPGERAAEHRRRLFAPGARARTRNRRARII